MKCCCCTELEAIEACEWLREAGFPQYSQLYRSTYMAKSRIVVCCRNSDNFQNSRELSPFPRTPSPASFTARLIYRPSAD